MTPLFVRAVLGRKMGVAEKIGRGNTYFPLDYFDEWLIIEMVCSSSARRRHRSHLALHRRTHRFEIASRKLLFFRPEVGGSDAVVPGCPRVVPGSSLGLS